jgi:hypothetical protein
VPHQTPFTPLTKLSLSLSLSMCVCAAWGLRRGGGGADTVYEVFGLGAPWDESGTESEHSSNSKAAASIEDK